MDLPPYPGPTLVTLLDGQMVFSDAEAWRHEAEARQILAMGAHADPEVAA